MSMTVLSPNWLRWWFQISFSDSLFHKPDLENVEFIHFRFDFNFLSTHYFQNLIIYLNTFSVEHFSSKKWKVQTAKTNPGQEVRIFIDHNFMVEGLWKKQYHVFRISHVFYVIAFAVNNPNCINFKSNILTTFAQPTFNKCLKLLKRAKQSSDSRMEQLKSDLILRQLKTIFRGKWFCWNNIAWFMLVTYVEDKITVTVWPCWS